MESTKQTILVERWREFAEILIRTNELDPAYEVIARLECEHDDTWMGDFMIYYIMFYDLAGAYKCAEYFRLSDPNVGLGIDYWHYLRRAALDPKTRRGGARRHFRADNAMNAIDRLASFGMTPSELWRDFHAPTYHELYVKMTTRYAGCQIGPYFIWKILDLQEVCFDRFIALDLKQALKYMPDPPRKAAARFFPNLSLKEALIEVVCYIQQFRNPVNERPCSYQEAETILCAFNGYYGSRVHWIGEDIQNYHDQLAATPELIQLLPPVIAKGTYTVGEFK